MIPYKQLSLADIFTDCQDKFENDKSAFLSLFESHINSTPREILDGRTPYQAAAETLGEDVLKAFQLKPIAPDDVNLTPKLIRFNK